MLRVPPCVFLILIVLGVGCQSVNTVEEQAEEEPFEYRGFADDALYLRPYELFLKQRGRYVEAHAIDSLLAAHRYPNGYPSVRDSIDLREQAYHMAMDGVTVAYLKRLADERLNVPAMDWRRQREAQAATTEIVVRASVLGRELNRSPADAYRSTILLSVEQLYKGTLPYTEGRGDILIRRKSGRTGQGRVVNERNELDLATGETYLFFLSSNLYEFETSYSGYLWMLHTTEEPFMSMLNAIRDSTDSQYVLERHPAVRLDWLPESRRVEFLNQIARISSVES